MYPPGWESTVPTDAIVFTYRPTSGIVNTVDFGTGDKVHLIHVAQLPADAMGGCGQSICLDSPIIYSEETDDREVRASVNIFSLCYVCLRTSSDCMQSRQWLALKSVTSRQQVLRGCNNVLLCRFRCIATWLVYVVKQHVSSARLCAQIKAAKEFMNKRFELRLKDIDHKVAISATHESSFVADLVRLCTNRHRAGAVTSSNPSKAACTG